MITISHSALQMFTLFTSGGGSLVKLAEFISVITRAHSELELL